MTELLDGLRTRPHEDLSVLINLVPFTVSHTGKV